MTETRRENLVRAIFPGVEVRAEADGSPILAGHFARFNEWNEIDSVIEGRFLERIAPGAFVKTFTERTPKILLNHGKDPELGDRPIAVPRSIGEDDIGPAYEAALLDGLPPMIVAGLRAGQYGASYRFSIPKGKDDWNRTPKVSDYNPDGLPERTIREAMVFEFGPVTFPADAGATASVRSLTDLYTFDTLVSDPERLAALIDAKSQALTSPEPAPATPTVSRAAPEAPPIPERKETPPVETIRYESREDKASRVIELEASIGRRAVEYPGVLPDDIQAADDAENEEREQLVRDIAAWDARQARVASFSATPRKTEVEAPVFIRKESLEDIHDLANIRATTRSRDEYDRKVHDNALRSIDSARLPKTANADGLIELINDRDEGDEGEGETARRVLLTGSPAYRRAFNKYLRGEKDLWSPEESRAAALAVTGTTTTGGYAVPYVFDPTMIHIGVFTAQNPYRAACRVETITNGNNWRTVTVGAVTTAYAAEAAAATEQGPTLGQPTYTVQRAHAFATVSFETLQDRPDIGSELTSVFAESKATYEENQFTLGVGTTVFPLGMFVDTAYTDQTTATNDVTAIADLQVVEGALPLRFRANGAWFMNRSTLRQLMALDTTYRYFSGAGVNYPGQVGPIYTQGGNTGISLLGYPVWEVPSAVSTLTTDGAIIAVFADPKSYVIVDRIGLNVEVIPNMLNGATPSFPTGQRGIYCFWRNTAKPINADAGRSLSVQ
jgi:HK97 family phage major capsid protein